MLSSRIYDRSCDALGRLSVYIEARERMDRSSRIEDPSSDCDGLSVADSSYDSYLGQFLVMEYEYSGNFPLIFVAAISPFLLWFPYKFYQGWLFCWDIGGIWLLGFPLLPLTVFSFFHVISTGHRAFLQIFQRFDGKENLYHYSEMILATEERLKQLGVVDFSLPTTLPPDRMNKEESTLVGKYQKMRKQFDEEEKRAAESQTSKDPKVSTT